MPPLAIHTARALTPLEEIPDALILVEDRAIRWIGPRAAAVLPPGAEQFDARAAKRAAASNTGPGDREREPEQADRPLPQNP